MNQNLKIFKIIAAKFASISSLNSLKIIEYRNMIKYGNFLIENRQKSDIYLKNIFLSFPTLKELI